MTIGELIELLAEYQDEHGEDCEVRLMTQQNWPFENRIAGVTSVRNERSGARTIPASTSTTKTWPKTRWSTSSKVARFATAANGLGETARDC